MAKAKSPKRRNLSNKMKNKLRKQCEELGIDFDPTQTQYEVVNALEEARFKSLEDTDMFRLIAKVDGSGNGARGSSAACVVFDSDGIIIKEKAIAWGVGTNNVAEYKSVLLAIEVARELEADELEILSDSQLIVNQVNGDWDCKDVDLQVLLNEVHDRGSHFSFISISWIPREQNGRADLLAGKALGSR